jgi:hypothetical protein
MASIWTFSPSDETFALNILSGVPVGRNEDDILPVQPKSFQIREY